MNLAIDLILIGGGGHCVSCIDVIKTTGKYNILGILDLPNQIGQYVNGVEIIGADCDIEKFHAKGLSFFITLGQIKTDKLRRKIFLILEDLGANIETIISPTALLSANAFIGKGTILMNKAVVNAGVVIGENCIVNTGAIVEHGVKIGDHCHISTGTVVNGDCNLGSNIFIGSGSVINQGISLVSNVVVGAGSLVVKNIESEGTYFGSPVQKYFK